jgi:hypothetical protein
LPSENERVDIVYTPLKSSGRRDIKSTVWTNNLIPYWHGRSKISGCTRADNPRVLGCGCQAAASSSCGVFTWKIQPCLAPFPVVIWFSCRHRFSCHYTFFRQEFCSAEALQAASGQTRVREARRSKAGRPKTLSASDFSSGVRSNIPVPLPRTMGLSP